MNKQEREEQLKTRLIEMKLYEEVLYGRGIHYIAGVDEVGRGPLAGPVVAAAVILPRDFQIVGIDDSKKLSEKKREFFEKIIKAEAVAYGVGMVSNNRIDQVNILEATKEAMLIALEEAAQMLEKRKGAIIEHVLFDAIKIDKVSIPQTSIIKGDTKSVSIAAASILAKVTRDRMMIDIANTYPQYAFERNKGYGTKVHYEGIHTHGICPIHRRSFLKKLV